jgi:hypothetical protein
MRDGSWTIRLDPELTRQYGVEEIYKVCFEPNGWPGKGPVIGLAIPECELVLAFEAADGLPVAVVNRPVINRSIRSWVRHVCKKATTLRAFVMFDCDTAEQADSVAALAEKRLPNHRRTALERMYNATDRSRDKLS